MHLFIVEGQHLEQEFRRKFGPGHTYDFCLASAPDLLTRLGAADVAFDLREWPELHYEQPRQPLFYSTTSHSLAELFHNEAPPFGPVFGFSGLPTLVNRPIMEVAWYRAEDATQLATVCASLGTRYCVVQDRVALLLPRVVCQSINEACFALQEGVASAQEIDLMLQAGSPYGPCTWANYIGISRVYQTLERVYQDTHEQRYKPCSLLKRMHLRGETFMLTASTSKQ
ncbi:3-hydroxyacyl-CoA dehydrogenase family protein [Hymenobacter tenuis]